MRYYNQADMILTVSATGVTATSGKFNDFTTLISSNELAAVVTTTNQFTDAREGKIVRPIDINIGALTAWSLTNTSLRAALGSKDVSSVYVVDSRTLAGTQLGAVRVVNGEQLPARGLTVATGRRCGHDSFSQMGGPKKHELPQFANGRSHYRQRCHFDRSGGDNLGQIQWWDGEFPAFPGNLGHDHFYIQWFNGKNVPEPLCHKLLGQ
jgi:hypothetical protein